MPTWLAVVLALLAADLLAGTGLVALVWLLRRRLRLPPPGEDAR